MKPTLQKQIDEMSDDELKEVIRRDFVRKLTGYRMTDDFRRSTKDEGAGLNLHYSIGIYKKKV